MKLTIANNDGTHVWCGTVTEINQRADTVKETVKTADGKRTDFLRTGTGRLTLEFFYTNGPKDALPFVEEDLPDSEPVDGEATTGAGAEPEQ